MNRSEQKGFALIEILLVIVILGAIGFTGWFVWHSRQAADKSYNDATRSSQGSQARISAVNDFEGCKKATGSKLQETSPEKCVTKDGKTFTDTSTPAPMQPYMVIKEWGVELPLSAGIKDAYYTYDGTGADGYDSVAYVGTKSLAALDAECAAQPDKTGVGVIFRQSVATHDAHVAKGDPYTVGTVKIGKYYYGYTHAQAACSGTIDSAASKQQAADMALFRTAFQDMKAIQ